MAAETKYAIHVHPDGLSDISTVETVMAAKHTTAAQILDKVISRLDMEDSASYVLVEVHQQRGEEMVLAGLDCPVQRMLLWPRQFQHSYKFVMRQTDKDGIVLYRGTTKWQAKLNQDSTHRHMAQKGFLPPSELSSADSPDLCSLQLLTQDKLLEVLKMRFMEDSIYTYSGDILISINPYKFMPIYNPKYMTIYQNRKKEDVDPHIYAVADAAFSSMVSDKQNQCIVITGKSGSGKTQATHFLVHHTLALCQKSYMTGVEHMLVGCGPVLEALGNAQTEHNNNSSRFGKFLRIYFYESGLLSGADIQTYLLEKSRLVHQGPSERNFHIFYYLLCGATDAELSELHLDSNSSYNYVQTNMMQKTEALAELDRLRQAMEVVGFFAGAQKNIFRLISAILLLGNITFRVKKGREESLEIEDETHLHSISTLLGLDVSVVRKCLLTRKAKAGAGERFVLDLKLDEAKATRDAMAKALYQSLFDWTVTSVNMALAQRTRDSKLKAQSRWIGLLDIFGFEDFVVNSFEQFCINYASEHLQHHCIKHTFQLEQEEYKQEGIEWKEVDYADNSGCLELYEKRPTGLFYLIDENFPGANNQILLAQFNKVHGSNRYYETTVVKEDAFIIKHFAGKVKYQIKDFREKNHDQVREDIISMLRTSRSSFIQDVISRSPAASFRWSVLRAVVRAASGFMHAKRLLNKGSIKDRISGDWRIEQHDNKEMQASYVHKKLRARVSYRRNNVPSGPGTSMREPSLYGKRKVAPTSRAKKKTNSIGQQHQASLASLMAQLEKAHPFFVRCIQPNNQKVSHKLDEQLVLHQLRCSGMLQTIKLQQSRYPQHLSPSQFLLEYRLLFPAKTKSLTLGSVEELLKSMGLEEKKHFQVGTTQIFLRDHALRALREQQHVIVRRSVILGQACVRRYIARRDYLEKRAAAIKIQSFYRMLEAQRQIEEWHLAASIIQDAWHVYRMRKCEKMILQFQAHCRGFLARKKAEIKRKKMHDARIIQRAWKSYRRRVCAAITIQKLYRGFVARRAFEVARAERDKERETEQSIASDPRSSSPPDITDSVDILEKSADHEPVSTELPETTDKVSDVGRDEGVPVAEVLSNEKAPDVAKAAEIVDSALDDVFEITDQPAGDVPADSSTDGHVEKSAAGETLAEVGTVSSSGEVPTTDGKPSVVVAVNHEVVGGDRSPQVERSLEPPKRSQKISDLTQIDQYDELDTPTRNKDSSVVLAGESDSESLAQPLVNDASPIDQSQPLVPNHTQLSAVERLKATVPAPAKGKLLLGSRKTADSEQYNLKAGDLFMKAAFPKSDSRVVKPVVFKPQDRRRSRILDTLGQKKTNDAAIDKSSAPEDETRPEVRPIDDGTDLAAPKKPDAASHNKPDGRIPFIDDGSYSLKKKPDKANQGNFRYLPQDGPAISATAASDDEVVRKPSTDVAMEEEAPNSHEMPTVPDVRVQETNDEVLKPDDVILTEINDMSSASGQPTAQEMEQLEKEWLAFQRVEHVRQLRELDKAHEGTKKENKHQRKIREEITALRLKQMSELKKKLDSYGISAESMPMPEMHSLSRTGSEKSDSEALSPTIPLSPSKSLPTKAKTLEREAVSEDAAGNQFPRSVSMESINREKSKPRRQRSNSTVESYVSPSSDPVSRKFAMSAEAFAKKCMEDSRIDNESPISHPFLEADEYDKHATPSSDVANKRSSVFMDVVRKTLWGSHRSQAKQPLAERKSNDSLASTQSEIVNLPATVGASKAAEDGDAAEVKFKGKEEERFSSNLIVSRTDELLLLDDFIKRKMLSFNGSHLVDQVFKTALDEFCTNLTAVYSFTELSGDTNGLRYKDIVNNFRQVLEKTANYYKLDQYAAMMAVNGFRGYMSEFMNEVLPKHAVKEAKARKKKGKEDVSEKLGHHFSPVQWGVTQVCESCHSVMWLMEAGLMCKVCKFACHKKCVKQLTDRCPGAIRTDGKPKKLFGEALSSVVSCDCLVPTFVDKCISYMEMNGIYQEGIYRKSAASTQIKQMEEAINKDMECEKINFDDYQIHTVAAVFKKFLRSLPEPVVPYDKYFEFLQASKLSSEREKINSLFSVLEGIPRHNHATLERIIFHLARVAQQEPTNLMSPNNLAIVFTPCFISPPPHVAAIEAAAQLGDMTKGIELVIKEQVQKIRSTLESLSAIENVESSSHERLQKIRQSMGKGKGKRKLRSSFREGPRSPNRRSMRDRHLDSVEEEEDANLAMEERKIEQRMATLRSRKETLTSKLPSLTPQNPDHHQRFFQEENLFHISPLDQNEHLRHLNKRRVSQLPRRRRPTRFAAPRYNPISVSPLKEGKALRKVSTPKGKLKRLASARLGEFDSFRRSSLMRNPVHRKRDTVASPLAASPRTRKVTAV